MSLKIIHISDTHNSHRHIKWKFDPSQADVIVHSGDMSNVGSKYDINRFFKWFAALPVKYKISIAGNHDKCFDKKFWNLDALSKDRYKDELYGAHFYSEEAIQWFKRQQGCFFLNQEEVVIDGIKFFGSPWSKSFHPQYWAFNVDDNVDAYTLYAAIPDDTDVLITHGPAFGKLDLTSSGIYAGSEILRERIKVVKPKLHLFGHIHEAYGQTYDEDTVYSNASIMTLQYEPNNEPIIHEI